MTDEAEDRDPTAAEESPVVIDPSVQLPDQDEDGDSAETGIAKALKDTKAELTRTQQERAKEREEFTGKLAKLEGMVQGLASQRTETPAQRQAEPVADPFEMLDSEDFKAKFYEDAGVPIAAMKKIVSVVGAALAARDEEYVEALRKQKAEILSMLDRPDPALAEKVAELKKDPELAGLDDKALAVIAKRFAKPEAPAQREFPGAAPSGGRRPSAPKVDPEFEKMINASMRKVYGDA